MHCLYCFPRAHVYILYQCQHILITLPTIRRDFVPRTELCECFRNICAHRYRLQVRSRPYGKPRLLVL